ncbi:hypothetical protein AAMO2058_000994800 [Amorphochlora amoebiformis]
MNEYRFGEEDNQLSDEEENRGVPHTGHRREFAYTSNGASIQNTPQTIGGRNDRDDNLVGFGGGIGGANRTNRINSSPRNLIPRPRADTDSQSRSQKESKSSSFIASQSNLRSSQSNIRSSQSNLRSSNSNLVRVSSLSRPTAGSLTQSTSRLDKSSSRIQSSSQIRLPGLPPRHQSTRSYGSPLASPHHGDPSNSPASSRPAVILASPKARRAENIEHMNMTEDPEPLSHESPPTLHQAQERPKKRGSIFNITVDRPSGTTDENYQTLDNNSSSGTPPQSGTGKEPLTFHSNDTKTQRQATRVPVQETERKEGGRERKLRPRQRKKHVRISPRVRHMALDSNLKSRKGSVIDSESIADIKAPPKSSRSSLLDVGRTSMMNLDEKGKLSRFQQGIRNHSVQSIQSFGHGQGVPGNTADGKGVLGGVQQQNVLNVEAAREGNSVPRLHDIKSVHVEHTIPYLLRLPKEYRVVYRRVLQLAVTLASKVDADGWQGVVFLLGNAHKTFRCLRNRMDQRRFSRTLSGTKKSGSFKSSLKVPKKDPNILRSASDSKHGRSQANLGDPELRNVQANFENCLELVRKTIRKGNIYVVSFTGVVQACARGVNPPSNFLKVQMKARKDFDYTTSKWGAMSRCPCFVIRAPSDSRGRVQVFYDGSMSLYGANRSGMNPQGVNWLDPKLWISEESVPPLVPHSASRKEISPNAKWHPRMLDLELMERKSLRNETLQSSVQCVVGDPTLGVDDLVRRFTARAASRYDAVIWIPGTSEAAAKGRILELGYYLRLWTDLIALPFHNQRLALFYEELLTWYSKVLIVVTSVFNSQSVLDAIAPPGPLAPDSYVHFVVGSKESLKNGIAPRLVRIEDTKLRAYRPSQSLRILDQLPFKAKNRQNDAQKEGKHKIASEAKGKSQDEQQNAVEKKLSPKQVARRRRVIDKLHLTLKGNPLAVKITCAFICTGATRGRLSMESYLINLLDSLNRLEETTKDSGEVAPHFAVVADAIRALRNHRTPVLILSILAYMDPSGTDIGVLRHLTHMLEVGLKFRFKDALKVLISIGLVSLSPDLNTVEMHVDTAAVVRTMLRKERLSTRVDEKTQVEEKAQAAGERGVLESLVSALNKTFRYLPGSNRGHRRDNILYLHVLSVASHAALASSRLDPESREAGLVLLCRAAEFVGRILQQSEEAFDIANSALMIADGELLVNQSINRVGALVRMHCSLTLGRASLEVGRISEAEEEFCRIITDLANAHREALHRAGVIPPSTDNKGERKKRRGTFGTYANNSENERKALGPWAPPTSRTGPNQGVSSRSSLPRSPAYKYHHQRDLSESKEYKDSMEAIVEEHAETETKDPEKSRIPKLSVRYAQDSELKVKKLIGSVSDVKTPTTQTLSQTPFLTRTPRSATVTNTKSRGPGRPPRGARKRGESFPESKHSVDNMPMGTEGAEWQLPPMAEGLWVMAHVGLAQIYILKEDPRQAHECIIAAFDAVELGWGHAGQVPADESGLAGSWWRGSGRPLVIADLRDNLASTLWRTGCQRIAKGLLVNSLCSRYINGGGTGPLHKHPKKRKKNRRLPGVEWVRGGLGRTCNSLGVVLTAMGRLNTAHRAFEAAYSVLSHCHGTGSPEVATVLSNWASVIERKGAISGSLEGVLAGLTARRRLYGDRSMMVAEARNNLGIVLWKLGGPEALSQSALELNDSMFQKLKLLGEGPSVTTAHGHVNTGNVLSSQDEGEAAIEQFENALRNYERTVGEFSVEMSNVFNNVAVTRYKQGKFGAARKAYDDSLKIRKKVLGGNHPLTKTSEKNYGIAKSAGGHCVVS